MVEDLKRSQKDTKNRIHPWMTSDITQTIISLSEEDSFARRATNLAGDGIDAVSSVFRSSKSNKDDLYGSMLSRTDRKSTTKASANKDGITTSAAEDEAS